MQATLGHRKVIGGFRFARVVAAVALIGLLTALVVGSIGIAAPSAARVGPDVNQALIDHRAGERALWTNPDQDAVVERALVEHRADERTER